MKRILMLISLLAVMAMTGCSGVNFSVDTLLTAPKLTKEQKAIHMALVQSVGSNITLKYPKSGDNRSAYVIKNIDDEAGAEALVFYEYAGASNKDGLMVNLLDQKDDEWVSIKEFPGSGSEVSTVIISDMGNDKDTEVIIGYTSSTSDVKTLVVYQYTNGELKTIGTENYSLLEVYDINNDHTDDLVVVNKNLGEENNAEDDTCTASLLEIHGEELARTHTVEMCNNVTSYVNTAKGKINHDPAVYLDELTNKYELQTEIIYFGNDVLVNPIETAKKKLLPVCTRPAGYYSRDYDKDGTVEIPSVRPMTGYENAVEEEKLYLTDWYVYENGGLALKSSGDYCLSDGYVMIYPSRWAGQVTVKKNSETQETVFYKYDGDINGGMTELMRVAGVGDNQKMEYLYDGYQLINEKSQICYLVKMGSQSKEPLVPTIDEIKNCFYIAG